MEYKTHIKTIAVVSIVANIIFVCLLMQALLPKRETADMETDSIITEPQHYDVAQSEYDEITSHLSIDDLREFQIYNLNKPIFYGKWKIAELIWPELAQPSYLSGFRRNKDGSTTFRGPDTSSILGEEITFALDTVEYSGSVHEYISRPRTYSYPLTENTVINYNYSKTLGITGNYYSVVKFLLPEHDKQRVANEPNEVRISDIRELYIKDKDTMYADAYFGITYRLERITD